MKARHRRCKSPRQLSRKLGWSFPSASHQVPRSSSKRRAEDTYGNFVATYNGSTQLSTSDPNVQPTSFSLTNGSYLATVKLYNSGTRTLTVTNVNNATLTGSGTINVTSIYEPPAYFTITGTPAEIAPGTEFDMTVVAYDSLNHLDTSYNGRVQFTSSDVLASLPGGPTLNSGYAVLPAILQTPGVQTIRVADSIENSETGATTVSVSETAAVQFGFSVPATVTAGVPFSVTVSALDQDGSVDQNYAGRLEFAASARRSCRA